MFRIRRQALQSPMAGDVVEIIYATLGNSGAAAVRGWFTVRRATPGGQEHGFGRI